MDGVATELDVAVEDAVTGLDVDVPTELGRTEHEREDRESGLAERHADALAHAGSDDVTTRPMALIAQSIDSSPIDWRKSGKIGVSMTPGDTELSLMPRDHHRCELAIVQTMTASLEKL